MDELPKELTNARETSEEQARRLEQIRENLRNRLAKILGNPLEPGATLPTGAAQKHDTAK
jgi:hypothetical protein